MLLARLVFVALLALALGPASGRGADAVPGSVAIAITPLGVEPATVVTQTPHVGWVNRDAVAHTVTFEGLACSFTLAAGESTLSPAGVPVKGCSFTSPRGPTFNFPVGRYVYRVDGFPGTVMGRLAVTPVTVAPLPGNPEAKPQPRETRKPAVRKPKPAKSKKKKHCHVRSRR